MKWLGGSKAAEAEAPPRGFDFESLNSQELRAIADLLDGWRDGGRPSLAEAAQIARQVVERRGPIVDERGRSWSMTAGGKIVRMG